MIDNLTDLPDGWLYDYFLMRTRFMQQTQQIQHNRSRTDIESVSNRMTEEVAEMMNLPLIDISSRIFLGIETASTKEGVLDSLMISDIARDFGLSD